MKLKRIANLLLIIGGSFLLSGCLPTEKTTQCGTNEAYNATRRTCVPVVGSASSNTVFINSKLPTNSYTTSLSGSSVSHTISVSDIYGYGYTSKWFLNYTNGSTNLSSQVASNTSTYTFNPAFSYGSGDYVLEAVLYDDANEILDSVTWSITISSTSNPQVTNPVPNAGSYSYASNITSADVSVDLDNPDGVDGNIIWLVDGITDASSTFNSTTVTLSHTIDPEALGVGIHTVEAKLTHIASTTNIYDSYVWVINVIDPDLPTLTSADPTFAHTVMAVDSIDYTSGGWVYDHDGDSGATTSLEDMSTKTQSGGSPGLCIYVDDWDKDGDGVADVYLKFDINGAQQGPLVYLSANEYCVTTDLSTQILTNSEIGVSKTITVSSYVNGSGTLIEQRTWALNVIPRNSAPIIQISSNTDSFGCTITSGVSYTGCTITQSADDDLNGNYTGASDVDNVKKFAIDVVQDFETDYVNDSDTYGEDNNAVYFQIKKVTDSDYDDVDGASDYTRADCTVASGVPKATITDSTIPTGVVTTYFCDLSLDAFNANGPVESGDYIVRAYVTDAGSEWSGLPKDSNKVIWEITVEELQTSPVIQAQDFATGSTASNASYITTTTDGSGCTADTGNVLSSGVSVSESTYIVVHTLVKELERDNMTASVKMENLLAGAGTYSQVSALQTVTRTDDAQYYDVESCFKVPEWAVTTAGTTTISLYTTITDKPDDSATEISVSNSGADIFYLDVDNYNPTPVFDDDASPTENVRDLSLDSGGSADQSYAFGGYPFSITVPGYSDASTYDGANVTWQWQVCVGDPATTCDPASGTYTDMPGADSDTQTSADLVYTPDPSLTPGSTVNLRLCLGDDGTNAADCTSGTGARKTYTNLIANPASYTVPSSTTAPSSGNTVAQWYDATNDYLYVAYASGTDVYVEKLSNDDTGTWTTVHAINFPSDPTTPVSVSDLSMIGEDSNAILLSYVVNEAVNGNPVVRIRRLDISNNTLGFNYTGIFNDSETVDEDMIDGLDSTGPTAALTNTTFAVNGNNQLDMTFTGTPTGSVTFRLASGAADVTLTYNSTEWCLSGCGSTTATATSLAGAINADADLSQEYFASVSGSTVTVVGMQSDDYLDLDAELAIPLGNIIIHGGVWMVPFADGATGLQASVILGTTPGTALSGFVPGTRNLSTLTSLNDVRLMGRSDGGLTLLAAGQANMHVYNLDASVSVSSSAEYIFSSGSFLSIDEISLSLDANDVIYAAGVGNISGSNYLSAAVIASDLSEYSVMSFFNGSMNYLTQPGIEDVEIVASADADGSAVIALTTDSSHASIPNQAHLIKVEQDLGDFTASLGFVDYQLDSDLSSPAINDNDTYADGGISVTQTTVDLTKGMLNDTSAGAADNTQPTFMFSWHEDNAGVAEVKTAIINSSEEDIQHNTEDVSGSYPAFLSN